MNQLKHKNIYLMLGVLISSALTFQLIKVRADIPSLPPNTIYCTCASSAAATCVTKHQEYQAGPTDFRQIKSSCDSSNNYNTLPLASAPPSTLGNLNSANGVVVTSPNISNNIYNPYEPLYSIGTDTGVACIRSGGISGTLKSTGYDVKTSISINNSGGTHGGGSVINYVKMQFSCY